jgi:hypothetical protein
MMHISIIRFSASKCQDRVALRMIANRDWRTPNARSISFHYKKYNFWQQFFLLQVAGKIIQNKVR